MSPDAGTRTGALAGLRALATVHRTLRDAADLADLLARAAAVAPAVCGVDRALVVGASGGRLTAGDSAALEDRGSDLLRRRLLAAPVAVRAGTPEAAVVQGRGTAVGSGPGSGPLAGVLGLAEHALIGLAPDGLVVGVLVLDRDGPPVDETVTALGEALGMVVGLELERILQRVRATDLAAEVRQHQAASDALVRELLQGQATFSAAVAGSPIVQFDQPGAASPGGGALRELLSEAELRTARLLVRGLSNRQIAEELIVSPETVKTHVGRVLRKLGAANRAEAVYRLIELDRGA